MNTELKIDNLSKAINIEDLYVESSKTIDPKLIEAVQKIDYSKEPLLQDNPDLFFLGDIPPKFKKIYKLYKTHQDAYWPAEDVSMEQDKRDWENLLYDQTSQKLNSEERIENERKNNGARFFIKMTLAFFATADGIVNSNLIERFCKIIKNPYSRSFYCFQMMMENIHSEAYSKMLQALVPDQVERDELFHAIYRIPVIRKKALFALKYMTHPDQDHYLNTPGALALQLVAQACMEMINFSSSFASIYWIRSKGKMPGLAQFNMQIAADEGLHGENSIEHYLLLENKLPQEIIHYIIRESYAVEEEFFRYSLPVDLIGMNANEMSSYVKVVCNRLSEMLGYDPVFPGAAVPPNFSFVEKITLNGKTNFHEMAPVEYQQSMIKDAGAWGMKFNF